MGDFRDCKHGYGAIGPVGPLVVVVETVKWTVEGALESKHSEWLIDYGSWSQLLLHSLAKRQVIQL